MRRIGAADDLSASWIRASRRTLTAASNQPVPAAAKRLARCDRRAGRVRQASKATTSAIAGDDAAEGLEGRLQAEVGDHEPGQHGGHRERGVGGDVERRHDRGAVLGGIAPTSARRPPRKATPNPTPPRIEPAMKAALEPVAAATTNRTCRPRARSSRRWRRSRAPCGRTASWASAADAASATIPMPDDDHVRRVEQLAESCGPSEKKSAPIDHDESTASAGQHERAADGGGTLGRSTRQPEAASARRPARA